MLAKIQDYGEEPSHHQLVIETLERAQFRASDWYVEQTEAKIVRTVGWLASD